jgi:hypothetical protein
MTFVFRIRALSSLSLGTPSLRTCRAQEVAADFQKGTKPVGEKVTQLEYISHDETDRIQKRIKYSHYQTKELVREKTKLALAAVMDSAGQ